MKPLILYEQIKIVDVPAEMIYGCNILPRISTNLREMIKTTCTADGRECESAFICDEDLFSGARRGHKDAERFATKASCHVNT